MVELILLFVLATAAAFRGWGIWPFALLAFSMAPAFGHASSGGSLLAYGVTGATLAWISIVGLVFMIVMGRER